MLSRYYFRSRPVVLLIISMILIHLWSFLGMDLEVRLNMYRIMGLSLSNFLSCQVWSLLSYVLFHASLSHLVTNLLMLYLFGRAVLAIFGHQKLLKIIFMSSVIGGLSHLLVSALFIYLGGSESCLIGISGVCYGLLVALAVFLGNKRMLPFPISGRNLALGVILSQLLLLLMSPPLTVPILSQIGHWLVKMGCGDIFKMGFACHLGGAFAGWWVARSHVLDSKSDFEHLSVSSS